LAGVSLPPDSSPRFGPNHRGKAPPVFGVSIRISLCFAEFPRAAFRHAPCMEGSTRDRRETKHERGKYMKKSITRLVSVAALTTVALLAQGAHPENGGGGSGSANPPDVATIVAHQVSFLTTLLTLTTGQATQATTIFTTALNSITPIDTQITTAQTALSAAIKSNTAATITTQAAAIGTLEGQIVAIQANADAAFYLLLTADQQTKLNNLGTDFFGQGLGGIHIPGGGH
jgi:Spy/CpxP family protein refolding chaperone